MVHGPDLIPWLEESRRPVIEFFVSCVPPKTTHHAKKIIHRGRFASLADKPELLAARETLAILFRPYQPAAPMSGPLWLHLEFTWPWRRGDTKRIRQLGRMRYVHKPDCSNAAKTAEDVLKLTGFFLDDNLICRLQVDKWIGDTPGITVRIGRLG